jgi:hypothetical protein
MQELRHNLAGLPPPSLMAIVGLFYSWVAKQRSGTPPAHDAGIQSRIRNNEPATQFIMGAILKRSEIGRFFLQTSKTFPVKYNGSYFAI